MHISEAFLLLSHLIPQYEEGKRGFVSRWKDGDYFVQMSHCLLMLILSYLLGTLTVLEETFCVLFVPGREWGKAVKRKDKGSRWSKFIRMGSYF